MARKREPIPPVDVLIPPRLQTNGRGDERNVATTVYLEPEQMEILDELRAELRKEGYRTMTAAALVRAAVKIAARDVDDWRLRAKGEV